MGQPLTHHKSFNYCTPWRSEINLDISWNGNTTIAEDGKEDNQKNNTNVDLMNSALQRMQSKRIHRLICKNKVYGRARSTINMMPVSDTKFEEGNISDAVLNSGSRQISSLSDPLNFGRFY